MIHPLLSQPTCPGDRPVLITRGRSTTWDELARLAESQLPHWAHLRGRRVGLVFRPSPAGLALLAALDHAACDTFLIDGHTVPQEAARLGSELGLGAVLSEGPSGIDAVELPDERPGSGQGTVTILTSGTTGKPKAARHTWASLSRPVRVTGESEGPVWLLSYRPHLYAGLQVLLQCLLNRGTLVAPDADCSPAETAELMRAARVAYASATPSYWRRLLLFADPDVLAEVPLVQITLGGEVVDQQIVDRLRIVFKAARIVHIYATTELGRCFSVSDGRAGFPSRYLSEPTADGVSLWIQDGELIVRSANAMRGYDAAGAGMPAPEGGFPTGDLVEVVEDRVYFVGRRTDMINVGGNKVYPIEVERVLRQVPGVADVRVYGKRSSIAGELVACQVVPIAKTDPVGLRSSITAACLEQLRPYQRPRLIDFVAELSLQGSGKVKRSAD